MTPAASEMINERDLRALERILETLDKCEQRSEVQFARHRQHERKPYRAVVSLFEPSAACPFPLEGTENLPYGYAYSLSQGGMGFLTLESFWGPQIAVGLHLPNGTVKWKIGRVVRQRPVPNERFTDYGVAFGQQQ